MGRLALLRVARWAKKSAETAEHPHLETLVDEEAAKVSDGYHYARWIVPLVGLFLAVACFLPLALTVHPLFWIGVVGKLAIGLALGGIFHVLAKRITPAQLSLRKRCIALANKLTSARNLLGISPVVSPKVEAVLDEAAQVYLEARPNAERDHKSRTGGTWSEATQKAQTAMDDAMAQLLSLAEPESPQAQEAALAEGWAEPLVAEMRMTAAALSKAKAATRQSGETAHPASSLSDLADARAHLERLETAVKELEGETLHEKA